MKKMSMDDKLKDIEFTDLLSLDTIQQMQDSFARAAGVASIITKPDGTPITKPSNFCQLCKIIRSTEKGLKNCYASDAVLGGLHKEGPIYQQCLSGGLWDGGASVTVNDKHIANWLIGQVKTKDLDETKILQYAKEIGVDEIEFRDALAEVTTMSLEKFKEIANSLYIFANQLSEQAFQNLQLKQHQEHLDVLVQDKIKDLEKANKQLKSTNEKLIALTKKQAETEKELCKSKEYIEKELNKSRTLFQAFMDNIPVCAYIKDRKLNHIFLNNHTTQLFGIESETSKSGNLFSDETARMLETIDKEVFTKSESKTLVYEFALNGQNTWFHDTKFLIQISENETLLGGVAFDITEQKKAEQELEKAYKQISKNEEKYRSIFDNSPVGICRYDNNTVITDCNQRFAEILGAPREKIIGLNMNEKLPNRKVVNELQKTLKTGAGHLEIWYTSYTGNRTAFLKTRFKAIYNNEGRIDGGLFLMEDLTEKKKAEEELEKTFIKLSESEEKFRAIFFMTPDAICIHSMDGKYVDVNEAFTRLSGYSKQEVLGKTTADINGWTNPEDRITVRTALTNDGILENFETEYQAKDGSITSVLLSTNVVSLNKTPHILSLSKDISTLKKTERELTQLKDNLEQLVETRTAELQKVLNEQKIILDNIGLGVALLYDRELAWSNQCLADMLGYGEAGLPVGASPRIAYRDEQDYINFGKKMYTALGNGETAAAEHLLYRKDGSTFWCRLIGTAVHPKDLSKGAIWIFYDLTERKKAETELHNLKNYLSSIIDSMPSVLVGVDRDGRVTQWNHQAQQTSGLSREDVLAKSLTQVFPRLAGEMHQIETAMRECRVISTPKVSRKTKTETRYENITIFPLKDDGMEGAVIRVDDVTEQVRLEEMIIQSEKMLSVGGLAAGMAHEVNNPLAGVMQTAQVLSQRLKAGTSIPANLKAAEAAGTTMESIEQFMEARGIQRMIEAIMLSGQRASEIVSNMLSFVRKDSSPIALHDLGKILDKTIELAATDYDLKKNYDFKQIEIIREYDDNLPAVPCQDSKIQQVILNILTNGAQAMKKAGALKSRFILRTYPDPDQDMACIEIQDNGPGMDEKTRKQIFDPFFTTKPVGMGTGLGLSVSYFIITENHKGELTVETSPGAGAKFIIRLPLSMGRHQHET
nr:PAS domain S-box protein [uncultured Desulfobacter sp.]